MRANRMLMATMAAIFVTTVGFQTGSFASSGKGRDGSGQGGANTVAGSETRIVAKMVPTVGQDQLFEGHAARRTQGTRDEFEARVEVPLSFLGQTDPADLHPDLILAGGAIHCMMVLDEVESVRGIAEYKVSVRSRNGVPSNRAGSCGLPGTPPAVPSVNAGDSASVTIGEVSLQGTFAAKR